MERIGLYSAGFYIWWIFINGLLCFFEILFLQNLAGVRKKMHVSACLTVNCLLTFLVMYLQSSEISRLILHTGVIFCFCVFSVKLKAFEAIIPIAVILSLYSFMEGFQAVFMGRLVQINMSGQMAAAVQLIVSAFTALLMAGALWLISKRLSYMIEERESSYQVALKSLGEVNKKNERYRAYQHDIDNHFLVLSGLVHEKRYAEAEKYFGDLSSISEGLLGGIDTGNPAADILLKEKINFAEANEIKVSCDVHFSEKFLIDDADLCILLANAMDNAIQACMKTAEGKPKIAIAAGMRRDFLLISVTNTWCPLGQPGMCGFDENKQNPLCEKDYGIGLKNIKRTIKKYGGIMETERNYRQFKLSMMLCLKPFAKRG